mgnify:CR=1 FL=1|jgi:hypothetical protein
MTLREIFGSIIDFDLSPIFGIVVWGLLWFMPVGFIWFGGMLLKNVFIDEQPHDRDLFAKIFMVICGLFTWGMAIFIFYNLITL